jgi:hypothetical protein
MNTQEPKICSKCKKPIYGDVCVDCREKKTPSIGSIGLICMFIPALIGYFIGGLPGMVVAIIIAGCLINAG